MIVFRFPASAACAIAFALTIGFVPVVRAFCIRWRIFDAPGPLKIHFRPVPRLGGVAIFIAIFAVTALAGPRSARSTATFLAALTPVWLAGFIDDLRGLSPAIRLVSQVAAGALLWAGAWRISVLGSSALGLVIVCATVMAFANSINLLDGMDALASGTVAIMALAYLALPLGMLGPVGRVVAAGIAGACFGLLPANWPVADIFLGDSGSTLLGFAMAFLGIDLWHAPGQTPSAWAFPLLVAALPLLDACLAALRRIRHQVSPLHGDRHHGYDILRARGWSIFSVLAALYSLTAALSAIALCVLRRPSLRNEIGAAVALASLLFVAIRMGSLHLHSPAARPGKISTEEKFRRVQTSSF